MTAKPYRLETLIHELFDEDSDNNDELDCIGPEAAKQFGLTAEMLRAATDFPGVELRDMDALSSDSEHPLLKALEMSMTALLHNQLVQISAQSNYVQAAGSAAQLPAVARSAHPLPGLAILRGALSVDQQLEVASAILRGGCLVGEGPNDCSSSVAAGDPTTATAAADEGFGGSGRPAGLPNQAMFFGDLPAWATHLTGLLTLDELLPADLASRQPSFDQAIVNLYRPGEGICSHVDLARFEDGIVGVSIGGPAIMHFTRCDLRVGGGCGGYSGGAQGGRVGGAGASCGASERQQERPAALPVEREAGAEQEALAAAEGLRAKEAPTGPALKRPRHGPDVPRGFQSGQRLQQWPTGASQEFTRQDQQRLLCESDLGGARTASGSGNSLSAAGTDCPTVATSGGGGGGGLDTSETVRPESQLRGAGAGSSLDDGVWWCGPDHLCVLLQGGDLLGLAGEARYGWEHGIRPVATELLGQTGCDRCTAAAAASSGCLDVPMIAAAGCCGLGSDKGRGTGPEELKEPAVVGSGAAGAAAATAFVVTGGGTAPCSELEEAGHGDRKVDGGECGAGTAVAAAAAAVVDGGGCRGDVAGPVPIPVARGVRLSITLRRLCPDIVLCDM